MTRYRDDRFDRFDDRDDRYTRERQGSTGRYSDPRQYENHDERQLHGFDRQGFEQNRPYRPDLYRQQQGYSQDDARSSGGRPGDSRYGVNADRSGMGYSDLMDYDRGYSYDDRPQYGQRDFRHDGIQGQGRYQGGYGQSAYGQGSQYSNDQRYDWEGLRHASQLGQQQSYAYGQSQHRQYGYGQAEYDAPQFGDSDFRSGQYQGSQYGTRSYSSQPAFGQSQYGQSGYQSQGSQYSYGQTHQGKGPKGYQRSDDRIKEQVNDALEEAHDVDASEIDVQVMSGEVTLTGTVTDRMQKRRAEETVEHLRGVKDVHNQLRVQQGQFGQSGSQVLSSGLNSQSGSQQQGGNLGGSSMSSAGNQSTGPTGTAMTSSDSTKR